MISVFNYVLDAKKTSWMHRRRFIFAFRLVDINLSLPCLFGVSRKKDYCEVCIRYASLVICLIFFIRT